MSDVYATTKTYTSAHLHQTGNNDSYAVLAGEYTIYVSDGSQFVSTYSADASNIYDDSASLLQQDNYYNYIFTFVGGTFTISQRALEVKYKSMGSKRIGCD